MTQALATMVDPFTGKRWTPAEMLRSSAHRTVEHAFWSAQRGDWATAHYLIESLVPEVAWFAAHERYDDQP